MAPDNLDTFLQGGLGGLQLTQVLAGLGTAVICIDMLSQTVCACNSVAAELLAINSAALDKEEWWQVLGSDTRSECPFSYAIEAGCRLVLPPLPLIAADGRETIVSGQVTPQLRLGRDVRLLVLHELELTDLSDISGALSDSDTVAILGVDQVNYGAEWRASETRCLMMDLRACLLEIVRNDDLVSLPQGNYIAILLRDIGLEDAMDVSTAFLSHLSAVPGYYGPNAADARLSVGLSQQGAGQSSLQAIVAANNALFCAQVSSMPQRIKVASVWDRAQLTGSPFCSEGIFTEKGYAADYLSFLMKLQALELQADEPERNLGLVLGLLLAQSGVSKLALYGARKDGHYRYLGGGESGVGRYNALVEEELPRTFLLETSRLKIAVVDPELGVFPNQNTVIQPLKYRNVVLGYMALEYRNSEPAGSVRFSLDMMALQLLVNLLPSMSESADAPNLPSQEIARAGSLLDTQIEGYVVDNMEGAVDQATFLAKLDIPVAIVGPRGTGKMYIAKIVHQESGGAEGMMEQIDCREFRNRDESNVRISKILELSEGKTLVFKSPQLMAPDAQLKLAKQISSRTLADVKPARYLPGAKYVALFPDSLERLIQHSGLSEKLASVFAGYPINVPPVKDRKQAVLRWAHKILGQESVARDRPVKGFTPDAEQAMLCHSWTGNISEMRQCIIGALERSDNEWITPVDLGIFQGITPEGSATSQDHEPFLSVLDKGQASDEEYAPTVLEGLDLAFGEAVNRVAQEKSAAPLGAWLEDELVLAVTDRYQGDLKLSAEFLHTKPRNISRWSPKIKERQEQRNTASVWRTSRRLIGEWVRETPYLSEPPQQLLQNMLLAHVTRQCSGEKIAIRAKIMGVSVPTYQKRVQQL
ncbi:MAG: sigma 54-interacting transcriptional regulator [Halioglobus sp.]